MKSRAERKAAAEKKVPVHADGKTVNIEIMIAYDVLNDTSTSWFSSESWHGGSKKKMAIQMAEQWGLNVNKLKSYITFS